MIFRALGLAVFPALALGASAYGPELQGFDYPYPVAQFEVSSQRQKMHMAYMDVHPKQENDRTVVLLHGKNFCAATWQATIETLVAAGYRGPPPGQHRFCTATQPAHHQD